MTQNRVVTLSVGVGLTLVGMGSELAEQVPSTSKNPQVREREARVAGREGEPAENVFKNIQVLKGMPAGRVLRIMEAAFSANLGVQCSHCHTPDAWESDSKPQKPIARAMWTFRAEVEDRVRTATGKTGAVMTCYTCHKGRAILAFAPDKGQYAEAPEPQRSLLR